MTSRKTLIKWISETLSFSVWQGASHFLQKGQDSSVLPIFKKCEQRNPNGKARHCLNLAKSVAFALPLAIMLGGCGLKPVKMADEKAFITMSKRMGKELKSRAILDDGGDYLKTFSFASDDYAEMLLSKLSPSFLYGGPGDAGAPATFAVLARGNQLKRFDYGFKLKTSREDITMTLIGMADWDGKGDEWLASCKVEPLGAYRTRQYYVAFPAPPAEGGVAHGRVIALDECFGLDCRLYISDSKITSEAPATVTDAVPGLKAVTEPPKAKKDREGGVQEINLP